MDANEAMSKADKLSGLIKFLEVAFEILDIKITEQLGKTTTAKWNELVDKLEAFEGQIEKVKESRDFYLSFALSGV